MASATLTRSSGHVDGQRKSLETLPTPLRSNRTVRSAQQHGWLRGQTLPVARRTKQALSPTAPTLLTAFDHSLCTPRLSVAPHPATPRPAQAPQQPCCLVQSLHHHASKALPDPAGAVLHGGGAAHCVLGWRPPEGHAVSPEFQDGVQPGDRAVSCSPQASASSRAGADAQLCTSLCTSAGPDPEAKEMTPSALEDERKRTVKEEGEILGDDQENKRKRHDGLGSRKAAPESLQANGDSASFVPEPESLMTGLISHNSDDHKSKQLCTSSVTSTHTGGIPCFSQNAITSSYSSTGGISQLWKRRAPTASPFSSQASSSQESNRRGTASSSQF